MLADEPPMLPAELPMMGREALLAPAGGGYGRGGGWRTGVDVDCSCGCGSCGCDRESERTGVCCAVGWWEKLSLVAGGDAIASMSRSASGGPTCTCASLAAAVEAERDGPACTRANGPVEDGAGPGDADGDAAEDAPGEDAAVPASVVSR